MRETNYAPSDGRKELDDYLEDGLRYIKTYPAIEVTVDNIEELAHSVYGTYIPDFNRPNSNIPTQPVFFFENYGEKVRRFAFIGHYLTVENGIINSYHPNIFNRLFKEI